ncbi:MAG: insulinase family protein [Myxococcales bacterium]|nr:insulinase family protein [Myxococcales bacterium]
MRPHHHLARSFPLLAALALLPACPAKAPSEPTTRAPEPTTAPSGPEAIIAASNLPPTIGAPLQADKMGVTIHRLKNGLTVYISTDRQKPRFNAWIAVRAGSRNDPGDSTGLAHYLEHMLFKGTGNLGTLDYAAERPHLERIQQLYAELRTTDDPQQRAAIETQLDQETQATAQFAVPNELTRIYSNLGVEGLNAFTSDEQTVYIADVPSNRLAAWATVESERFADPSFRLFFTEIEAVYEEKNLSLDSSYNRVSEALLRALFPQHPYGTQPTIGTVEHLKTPAYQDMVDYFHRWYVPNNMAVVLAGDVDAATALPVLERTLGRLAPKPVPSPEAATLTPISGRVEREVVVEDRKGVTLAWHTVPVTHADEPALVVMDWLMDNATSGLLNTELELTQKVPNAGSNNEFFNEAGFWSVRATARDEQDLGEVEAMLLGVVGKLKAGEFTQADIDAIKVNQDIGEKRQLESNQGRVWKMAASFIERRPWDDVVARDQALRAVTRDDVLRVANAYLGDNFIALRRTKGKQELPKIEKPSITPIQVDPSRQSAFASQILEMPAPQLEPDWLEEGNEYRHVGLPAGPMIYATNTRNDLFSLEYVFDLGSRRARLLCHALDLLDQSGYGELTAEALKKRLFALGTSIDFSCSADQSTISVEGVDANMEESLNLLRAWLRIPALAPETLAKLTENEIAERRNALDNSNYLGWAASNYARFGKDSEQLAVPSNKQLKAATVGKLKPLITTLPDYEHRTLYFGPRAPEDIEGMVGLGPSHKKVKPEPDRAFRAQKGVAIYLVHRETAKSSVSVTFPLSALDRALRPAFNAYGEYVGGDMGSLIFQEIREARGLAYSAYGYASTGSKPADQWALMGGMGTQVDKTPEALATYIELVQQWPLKPERFDAAKTALEQQYRSSRVDPRWVVYWVQSWDRLGEERDPRPWMRDATAALTVEQVQTFADRFKQTPVIISVVGDREKVDLEALKKIGPVTEVKPEQLVSFGAFPKEKVEKPRAPREVTATSGPAERAGAAKKKNAP